MADGKWISNLAADMPLEEAARRVLLVRLQVVRDALGLARQDADRDPEHVHRLRVGTRRAGAALSMFKSCLPVKAHRQAKKLLRRLRRAAGAARDWDVFSLSLKERLERQVERERPGLEFLLGYATGQRAAAQIQLLAANADYPFDFERTVQAMLAVLRASDDKTCPGTLIDMARPLLLGRLQQLDEAAARDLEDYDQLHQVRIALKRLRYAMEVLADCFAPAFRAEIYPRVEEVQEILGEANDSHVAIAWLVTLRRKLQVTWPEEWHRWKAGVESLLRHHQRRVPKQRGRFQKWWEKWRKDGEPALKELLGSE